jgi:ABC-2 type transport system permease protein
MSIISDALTLYKREMLIYKSNLRTNIVRSIVFPLFIIVIFGGINASVSNTPIAIVNYANNPQSMAFISSLQTNPAIQVSSIGNENDALNQLKLGGVVFAVIILPTFPSSNPNVPGIQIYYSNAQPTVVGGVLPIIESAANKFDPNSGASQTSAQQEIIGTQASSVNGQASSDALFASEGNYKDFLTGGILAMVVVFGALFGGGISLLSDRQSGNIKAYLITPINKNSIVLSRMLAGATQSLQFAFVALIIGILDGVTIAMGWAGIFYIAITTIIIGLGFSGLAMIVASSIKKVDTFAIFAQSIGLPLWYISGGIVPVSALPSFLQPLSVIDPLTYATDISRSAIMQGFITPSQLITDYTALILFAVVMLILSFRIFKSTIE